ncbi:MAG: DUF1211 domain-containing protein [Solirubrobacterales bacterium]|nr:DUF1211 domain-containing protein [Solirubrobacterales bacterium]
MAIANKGSSDHPPQPRIEDEESDRRWDKNRVETFSDAVFAIAITLLVLDIRVPEGLPHLGKELAHEWPSYLAYVTSFLTVGGVWIAHHRASRRLRFFDPTLMRLNLLLLLTTAFLPFPTGILAEALRAPEHTAETAVLLYGATVLVIEVVLQALTHYARSQATRGPESEVASEGLWHRGWLTPSLLGYFVAICIGLVGFPKIGAVLYLLLAIPGVLLIQVHRRPLQSNTPA